MLGLQGAGKETVRVHRHGADMTRMIGEEGRDGLMAGESEVWEVAQGKKKKEKQGNRTGRDRQRARGRIKEQR